MALEADEAPAMLSATASLMGVLGMLQNAAI
jgi:hypothetical protein